jgi:hypothetical protein
MDFFGGVFVFGKFEIEVFLSCYKKKVLVKKFKVKKVMVVLRFGFI